MAEYVFRDFERRLASGELRRIYYFHGEENFLQEKAAEMLEKALSSEVTEKCVFYGTSFDLNDFLSAAGSPPLFGGSRLIIVKEANKIKADVKKNLTAILKKVAGTFIESSYILFINPAKVSRANMDELRFFTEDAGDAVNFYPPYRDELRGIISGMLDERGMRMAPDDADYLAGITGGGLFDVKNEIEKLSLFAGGNAAVTRKEIDECSGGTPAEDVFRLADSIIAKDRKTSLRMLEALIGEGEEPAALLGRLSYSFMRVMKYLNLRETGLGGTEAARRLGVPIKAAGDFSRAAAGLTRDEVFRKMKMIFEAEYSLKSGGQKKSDLRTLVAALCD